MKETCASTTVKVFRNGRFVRERNYRIHWSRRQEVWYIWEMTGSTKLTETTYKVKITCNWRKHKREAAWEWKKKKHFEEVSWDYFDPCNCYLVGGGWGYLVVAPEDCWEKRIIFPLKQNLYRTTRQIILNKQSRIIKEIKRKNTPKNC